MQMVSMTIKPEADDVVPMDYDSRPKLYLSDDQVEALGITGVPLPGTVFTLQCRAVVERVTAEGEEPGEGEGSKPDVSLCLCITDMGAAQAGKTAASMLYGD